ncbi:MAG TPA: AraC family transcriptional regulator [Ruminococcaceae bacterium]|nr:AraC family transcriptional regulator [Oscillospiraceae bacterium]
MKIELKNLTPQIALAIKKTAVGMDEIGKVFDEVYAKLMPYLSEQGAQIAGAPYCAYMNCSDDFMVSDMEFGIPVSKALPAKGDLYMSKNCEGKAITTTHKGPYKALDAAYNALMDYAKDNSLELTGVYYDYYINDPDNTPESELLTQIVFPVK